MKEISRYEKLCFIEENIKKLMDQNKNLEDKLAIAVEALKCAKEVLEIEDITCLQVNVALAKIEVM